MLRLMRWLAGLAVAALVLGLGLYLAYPSLLTMVGRYLVTEHALAKADLVLVLSGEPLLRVPEAARLYHEAYAPKILLTHEPKERGTDELLRMGIRFPDSQEISLKILADLRVPRDAIWSIQERSNSSRAEMHTVARFLATHPVKRMIIVTSKSHSTRAHKIFAAGLGSKVQLIMHPVPNDPYDPARWWQDRFDAKAVLHEYQALADYWRLKLWERLMGRFRKAPAREADAGQTTGLRGVRFSMLTTLRLLVRDDG
jgi:uncharacterized SAM-binding protein YcdF (DUF218 family)